jgi:hypothetical protein
MSPVNDSSTVNLLIITALGIVVVVIALEAVFVMQTSSFQGRNKVYFLALLIAGVSPLYEQLDAPEHSYYDYLNGEAAWGVALVVVVLSLGVSCWLEFTHLFHMQGWKAMRGTRGWAYALTFFLCLMGSYLMLQNTASSVADMMSGPAHKTGMIQEVHLWTGKATMFGVYVTVDGTIFRFPNPGLFHTLSVGQVVQFVFGSQTHYAFSPGEAASTPLGFVPAASIGLGALILTLWAIRQSSGVPKPSDKARDVL